MLTLFDNSDGLLVRRDDGTTDIRAQTVWIDLFRPTKEEDAFVEKSLGITIPTKDEMSEIEASSRLYTENGAHYMTAVVLHLKDLMPGEAPGAPRPSNLFVADVPVSTPVTFILAQGRVVTVRYEEPRAIAIFQQRNQKGDVPCASGAGVFVGLIESIIDREADRVERIQSEVDKLSQSIFNMKDGQWSRGRRFDIVVKQIGREGELTSRSRESLQSIDRLLTYAAHVMKERGDDKHLRARIRTASRDVESLNQQVGYHTTKVNFLLDATLGMINIEQNAIIKLFSVVSVALMPPTLIASIYGMNFKLMPELSWEYGYPFAIFLMILSAIIPFWWFKRKGWF
ncbi:MAG: magnesium transporter CorA family protein [Hyphomicrobiales bacterium]|nr:magnesium transporter CorA family protein [Hyphomicrobiales bacterium]